MYKVGTIVVQCYVKYVYIANCNMVDSSDLICDTYMCIHLPYKSIKYLAYRPNLVGIFVSGTYLAITLEVCIAVGCILAHNVQQCWGCMPISFVGYVITYAVWQSYFFSNICLYRDHPLHRQLLNSTALM